MSRHLVLVFCSFNIGKKGQNGTGMQLWRLSMRRRYHRRIYVYNFVRKTVLFFCEMSRHLVLVLCSFNLSKKGQNGTGMQLWRLSMRHRHHRRIYVYNFMRKTVLFFVKCLGIWSWCLPHLISAK